MYHFVHCLIACWLTQFSCLCVYFIGELEGEWEYTVFTHFAHFCPLLGGRGGRGGGGRELNRGQKSLDLFYCFLYF